MTAFRHVLVPIDFGETSDAVIDAAIALVRKSDARLILTHAVFIDPIAHAHGLLVSVEEAMREARAALDAAVIELRQRYPNVDGVLAHGVAWEEIFRVAKAHDVDLIVMGTHGRHGLTHVFLGSVAEKVVRLSCVPVLTVSSRSSSMLRPVIHAP